MFTWQDGKGDLGAKMQELLAISPSDLPCIRIVKSIPNSSRSDKFKFDGDLQSEAAIYQFAIDFVNGKLKPYLRSQKPFPADDDALKIIVGSEFEKIT